MNRLIFHKYFISATGVREVKVSLDKLSDIDSYLTNFFPQFLRQIKAQNSVKYELLVNGETLPQSWLLQNAILDKQADIYIVPSIRGGTDAALAAIKDFDISKFLLQSAIAVSVNFVLGFVIQALLPKPKKQENQDRQDNDIFEGIVNTADSGIAIPLNYGLIRVGGQIVSSDIEVVTQQRVPDPVVEPTIEEVLGTGSSGGGNEALGSFSYEASDIADNGSVAESSQSDNGSSSDN